MKKIQNSKKINLVGLITHISNLEAKLGLFTHTLNIKITTYNRPKVKYPVTIKLFLSSNN